MELSKNQAALILGLSETGEINVDVAAADLDGLPGTICQAIALKLMQDVSGDLKMYQTWRFENA